MQEISQIRGPTAPETTSETIALAAGQYLKQLDSGSIAIMDPSLPTISGSLPASGTGTTDPPDSSVASDATTYPGAGDDLPGLIPYVPADLAGLTPDDADILPPETQYAFGAFRPAYCYLTKEPQSNCYQGTGRFPGDNP